MIVQFHFSFFLTHSLNSNTNTDNKYSELVISQTTTSHSGNYSCVTNNAISSSTLVHIFNGKPFFTPFCCASDNNYTPIFFWLFKGENPAAMQHGDYGVSICPSPYLILFLLAIGTYQMFCLYVY